MRDDINLDVTNLPEPRELALKTTNRTVPVSLRVKEDVFQYYLDIARRYNTTPSAIINNLINTYAEVNHDNLSTLVDYESGRVERRKVARMEQSQELCLYMRKQLMKFRTMSDLELLTIVLELCPEEIGKCSASDRAKVYLDNIRKNDSEHVDYKLIFKDCPVWCSSERNAKVHKDIISIPSRDFPLIAAVVMTFIDKRNSIIGAHGYSIHKDFLNALEISINKASSRNGLVNHLKMFFNLSEYSIVHNIESLWGTYDH